ncbi:MAG: hypothetical protein JW795_08770 [Chitinivibrionales bacterium]|nr:hypothetical protein [Chitinivibrionales bacterium]
MVLCFLLTPGLTESLWSQQQDDIDTEIGRFRKELAQTMMQRQKNREELERDIKEAETYKIRTMKRFSDMQSEMSSMKKEISIQGTKRDSIAALIVLEQSRQQQLALSQEALRVTLIKSCVRIKSDAEALPPMIRQQNIAAVELLKSELEQKTIDNIEALNRFVQILNRMMDATSTIQVSQESSPIPEIRGTVYRIRMGTLVESIVDMKGEHAAVWISSNLRKPAAWIPVENKEYSAMLLKAASIREGKALPAFAGMVLPVDSTAGGN